MSERKMDYPPWEELPHDIWSSISQRLPIVDRVHASVVCKGWSAALKQTPQPVWMLYSKDDYLCYNDMGDGATGKLINLHELRPEGEIIGSSKGWLVRKAYNTTANNNQDLLLLDPISRVQVPLPPLASTEWLSKFEISSEDASQAVVAVIDDEGKSLALCKPKDNKSWTIFKGQDIISYMSILFCNGILYAFGTSKYNTNQIQTHSIKLAGDYELTLKLIPFSLSYVEYPLEEKDPSNQCQLFNSYLMESNGELLLVLWKTYEGNCFNYSLNQLATFQVLKVEESDDKLYLTRLNSLDDHSLFIGNVGRRSLRDESFCKNCIYFLENLFCLEESLKFLTPQCKVYHLNDGRIEASLPRFFLYNVKLRPLHSWFFPNIKIGGFVLCCA